jgi:hypothetical protein
VKLVRSRLAGDIGEFCRDLERCQSYACGLMQNIYHRLYKVEYLFFVCTTIIIWVETSCDVFLSKSNQVNTIFDEETEIDAARIISHSPGPSSYYTSLATSQGLLPTALSSTCTRY